MTPNAAQVVALGRAGVSVLRIRAATGFGLRRIERLLDGAQVARRRHLAHTARRRSQLIDAVRRGDSVGFAARAFEVPEQTAHRWCRAAGVRSRYGPRGVLLAEFRRRG